MPTVPGEQMRFRSSWMSYVLHCLTRSFVLQNIVRYEQTHPDLKIDTVLELRGDAYWAAPIAPLQTFDPDMVHVKQCLNWKVSAGGGRGWCEGGRERPFVRPPA